MQPWGIVSWHGRWYLIGHDTDRGAPRVFRLSRIEGAVTRDGRDGSYDVPADHEPRAMISRLVAERDLQPSVLRVRAGAGHTLRRRARTVGDIDDDWSLVDVDFADTEALADEVAGFGPDVLVEQPLELREAVVRRLQGAVTAHQEAAR